MSNTEPILPMFPVVCAWCKKIIGETTVENSSGICQDCKEKFLADIQAA